MDPRAKLVNDWRRRASIVARWRAGELTELEAVKIIYNMGMRGSALNLNAKLAHAKGNAHV